MIEWSYEHFPISTTLRCAADTRVPSLRAAVLPDARIILSRQSLTSREEHSVYGTHCLRGRMMRPENATTGQQYKQTYALEDRLGLRGEIVNSNVFSVSTWQHPRFASWGPQGHSAWRRCLCGGPNPVNPINNGATVPAHVPAAAFWFRSSTFVFGTLFCHSIVPYRA